MNAIGVLLLLAAVLSVSARHKKEWELIDMKKASREVLSPLHHYDKAACAEGAGFYRDPTDCHQYIRCVDDFSTGRRFTIFFGRCRPGLVFDENISSCNWPELAAPCSNSPERLKETNKFKPIEQNQPLSQDNVISEHTDDNLNKPYPQQQEIHKPQDSFNQFVQQTNVIHESENEVPNTFQQKEDQNAHIEKSDKWQQVQHQQEPTPQEHRIQEPITQEKTEQVFQSDNSQEQIEAIPQKPEPQPVVAEEERKDDGQQPVEQQKLDEQIEDSQHQERVQTGFQEIKDPISDRINLSPSEQQAGQQQQGQSQWWIVDNDESRQANPSTNDQHPMREVSTTSSEPILCSSEGFYRHPSNCSRFVRCVKTAQGAYSIHFFECGNHLFFDEKSSTCIVAETDKCTSTRTKRQAADRIRLECPGEGFFRHPVDCRSFYRCVRGATGAYETHLFSCPETLVFDEEYATCNWPDKAPPCEIRRRLSKPTRPPPPSRQQYKPIRTTSKPKSDYFEPIRERDYSRNRYTQKPKYTTQSPSRGGQMCNSPGFYRHDTDCTKFYKCVRKGSYFVRYELSCPNNLAYDEATSRCSSQKYMRNCNRNNRPFPPRQNDEEVSSSTADNSAPEESDNIQCEKEGFYRNPNDCNHFYRCVDVGGDGKEFTRYDFKCPDGLVFDEVNSVCNWPDQSAPCDGSSGGNGGKDSDGDAGEGEPSPNEEEENSGVSSAATTETTSTMGSTTSEENTSTTAAVSESSSGPNEGTGESESSESGGECSQEGFFRNPDDCSKFYRCVDFDGAGQEFVRYDFDCPEGLVFDETNSVCNWPEDSPPCDSSSGEGGKNQGESSTSSTPKDQESTTKRQRKTTVATTPRESSTSESTTASTTRSTESSVTEASTTSSTNGDDSNSSESEGGTSNSGECTEAGFFRNPDDCNKFYRCVDFNENGQEFVKYDFSCPEGLVFDEANSVCNWPDQSAPCQGGSGKEGGSTDSDASTEKSTTSTTERPVSTSQTESTEGPTSTESVTTSRRTTSRPTRTTRRPTESTTSSTTASTSEQGTTSKDTSTKSESGSSGECSEAGFFRNPEDCGKFYRCVDYNGDGQEFVRYDFDCPEGLYFDDVNSVCNWPEQSPPCENGSDSTGEGTGKEGSTTSQTDTSKEEASSQASTTQAISTTEDSSLSESDECTEPGFFRCRDDCRKFYRCVDENEYGQRLKRYDFQCPEGLIFDDKNKKCDFPSAELSCDTDSTKTTGTASESTTPSTTQSTTQRSTTRRPTTQRTTTQRTTTQRTTTQRTTTQRTTTQRTTTVTTPATSTSSTTSSSSGSADECSEEGFFRNPSDCSQYYRCIDEGNGQFTREDFSCAEDEVFDEEMRYCNRKDLAPPCEETSSSTQGTSSPTSSSSGSTDECTEEGFFRNSNDCSKYYRCLDEGDGTFTREDFSCAEDEVFDQEMRYCNRKDLAPPCEESSSDKTTSETQSTTESSSPTTEDTKKSDCTESGFFRCPDDCTQFYRCVDESGDGATFVRYNFTCPEGLIFDEKNNKCAWPSSELTCDKESSSSSTTSSDTSTTSSTTGASSDCTEEGFFKNPDDCSKYYRCIDEGDGTFTREDYSCAEDEVFDEEMRYCNRKDLAPPCDESSSSTTESSASSTTESSSVTSESSSVTEDSESTSSSTSGSESSEPGECQKEGFHRHPDDCNKFYRCVDFTGDGSSFTKYEFECPEGLVFDEIEDVCNWPDSAPPCDSSNGVSSTTGDSGASTTQGESDSTSSDTSSTSGSTDTTIGSTGSTTSESGDTENTDSSSTASSTSSPDGTTSGEKSSSDMECTKEGFFRHPEDCTKFYRCVDFAGTGESYVRYDFECPKDLVFDEVNSVCNWPNMSPACDSGSRNEDNETDSTTSGTNDSESTTGSEDSESTTGSEDSETSTTPSSTSTTASSTTVSSTEETSSDSTANDSEFKCEEEGFFRDSKDCKKYYECKRDEDSGEIIKIDCECPDGQIFDEEGWYCNAEELSKPCDDGSFKCQDEGFFRDPEDCTKYYQCNRTEQGSFIKKQFQCKNGNVFDEEGRYCNAPELAQPCDDSSNSTETTSASENSSSSSTTASSESTSSSSAGSSESTTSSSTGSSNQSGKCTKEGFFRSPDDCSQYYQCIRNEDSGEFDRKDFTCPDGRIFDEGVSYCNDPELSNEPCESDGNGTSSTTESSEDSSSTTEATSTGEDSSSTTNPNTQSRRGGGDPECKEAGFFRHPKDCNKFYRCVDFSGSGQSFVRFDFDCPEGLHFDEVNSVCNWPTMSPGCSSENEFRIS